MGEGLSLCPDLGSHSSPMSLPALMAQSCPSSWRTGTHVASHTARPTVHFQGRLVLGGLVPSLPRLVASLVTQLLLLRPGSRPSEQGSVTLFAGTHSSAFPSTGWDSAKPGTWGGLFLLDVQPGQGGTFWGRSWREAEP